MWVRFVVSLREISSSSDLCYNNKCGENYIMFEYDDIAKPDFVLITKRSLTCQRVETGSFLI